MKLKKGHYWIKTNIWYPNREYGRQPGSITIGYYDTKDNPYPWSTIGSDCGLGDDEVILLKKIPDYMEMEEMSKLSSDEQLQIANAGGLFEVTGHNSWNHMKIRRGKKIGKVIRDQNGINRILTVKFNDDSEETIVMNNIGPDPENVHEYEYCHQVIWHRF